LQRGAKKDIISPDKTCCSISIVALSHFKISMGTPDTSDDLTKFLPCVNELRAKTVPHRVHNMDIRITPETLVPRLGELLIERGLLTADDLTTALDYQERKIQSGTPCLIGQALIELGLSDQQSIDEVVTIQIF